MAENRARWLNASPLRYRSRGILTATGVGTLVDKDKRHVEVGGTTYLLETALAADFALIHAFLADYLGNLSYVLTGRNFNPVMAMAGRTVITEAERIVPVGLIALGHVVKPAFPVAARVGSGGAGRCLRLQP